MDFENTFGRYIGLLHGLGTKRLNDLLYEAETEITADQFRLLTLLWKEDGIAQQKLACLLGRDRASVTRMADILENQHLITRIADKEDKRVNLLYLTKKGKELEKKSAECAQKVLDEMTSDFSEEEECMFKTLLQKAIKNFKKHCF